MSSYANYCQEQATDCARRAKFATSPEMVAYCRSLEFRWLRLSEQAQEMPWVMRAVQRLQCLRCATRPLHTRRNTGNEPES